MQPTAGCLRGFVFRKKRAHPGPDLSTRLPPRLLCLLSLSPVILLSSCLPLLLLFTVITGMYIRLRAEHHSSYSLLPTSFSSHAYLDCFYYKHSTLLLWPQLLNSLKQTLILLNDFFFGEHNILEFMNDLYSAMPTQECPWEYKTHDFFLYFSLSDFSNNLRMKCDVF